MTAAEKIFVLLEKQNKTQKELSEFLGVSESTVSLWQTGTTKSYNKHISKIASFLSVSADYLLDEDDNVIKKISTPTITSESALKDRLMAMSESELLDLLDYIEFIEFKRNHSSV